MSTTPTPPRRRTPPPEPKVPWLVQVLDSFKDGAHTGVRVFVLMFLVSSGLLALYLAPHLTAGGVSGWLAFKRLFGG